MTSSDLQHRLVTYKNFFLAKPELRNGEFQVSLKAF